MKCEAPKEQRGFAIELLRKMDSRYADEILLSAAHCEEPTTGVVTHSVQQVTQNELKRSMLDHLRVGRRLQSLELFRDAAREYSEAYQIGSRVKVGIDEEKARKGIAAVQSKNYYEAAEWFRSGDSCVLKNEVTNMRATIVIATMLAASQWLYAQSSPLCKLEIKSPKTSDTIETEIQIQGTASVPPGTYLWILAHRKGIAQWWPQGGGAARIENGDFDVFATLGKERDSGRTFEIMGVVVDKAGNDQLEKWVSDSDAKKNWDIGVKVPSPATGCESQVLTVVVKRR